MSEQELHEYRLTFGVRYATEPHPTFPQADPDGWVTILAPDMEAAREVAFSRLGKAWAFLEPPERMRERFFPHGEIARWSTEVSDRG